MGVEEQVPLTPIIKVYFDIDVSDNAVSGNGIIDGRQRNRRQHRATISDNHATCRLMVHSSRL